MWNMFSWKEFYQKDVALGYEVILALLDFESNQVEDKLASSQDKKFLDVSFCVGFASELNTPGHKWTLGKTERAVATQ